MTTLVAIERDEWVVMAADTRISDSNGSMHDVIDQKIINNSGILIGVAGDLKPMNIAHFGFKPPRILAKDTPSSYMTNKFIPALYTAFVDAGGVMHVDDEDSAEVTGSTFLIAVKGVVFDVQSNLSWTRSTRRLYSSGSGADYALAALVALGGETVQTMEEACKLASKAIEITSQLNSATAGTTYVAIQTKHP